MEFHLISKREANIGLWRSLHSLQESSKELKTIQQSTAGFSRTSLINKHQRGLERKQDDFQRVKTIKTQDKKILKNSETQSEKPKKKIQNTRSLKSSEIQGTPIVDTLPVMDLSHNENTNSKNSRIQHVDDVSTVSIIDSDSSVFESINSRNTNASSSGYETFKEKAELTTPSELDTNKTGNRKLAAGLAVAGVVGGTAFVAKNNLLHGIVETGKKHIDLQGVEQVVSDKLDNYNISKRSRSKIETNVREILPAVLPFGKAASLIVNTAEAVIHATKDASDSAVQTCFLRTQSDLEKGYFKTEEERMNHFIDNFDDCVGSPWD
jgi:hypothetical protein